jgi:hypothetical protein
VTKDPKNPHHIRIAYKNEVEYGTVKEIMESNLTQGVRILRDDIFPIRVDSINRTAILDENREIRAGVTDALAKENDT